MTHEPDEQRAEAGSAEAEAVPQDMTGRPAEKGDRSAKETVRRWIRALRRKKGRKAAK